MIDYPQIWCVLGYVFSSNFAHYVVGPNISKTEQDRHS